MGLFNFFKKKDNGSSKLSQWITERELRNMQIIRKKNEIIVNLFIPKSITLDRDKINRCIDLVNDILQSENYKTKDYEIRESNDLISLWKEKGLPPFFHWSGSDGGGCSGFRQSECINCIAKWFNILVNVEIPEMLLQCYIDRLSGGMYENDMTSELLEDINFKIVNAQQADKYDLIDKFFSSINEYAEFLMSKKSISIANNEGTCMATLTKEGDHYIYRLDWTKDGKYIGDYIIPFKATQENINKFNQGCKIMADRLVLYIETNNVKSVPVNPAAFGDLTYKKTEEEYVEEPEESKPSLFIDENGEPLVLKHNCSADRIGKEMTREERHKFAVELLADLYTKAGMTMVNVNRNYDRKFPNLVMKSKNGRLYYVIIETTCYPNKAESLYSRDFSEMKEYAKEHNAMPTFAGVSFLNIDRGMDDSKMICGDSYIVAFKGLETV